MNRRTLRHPTVTLAGTGLFTARPATLRILPAAPGEGLAARRADSPAIIVPATIDHLHPQPLHPAFAAIPPRHTNLSNAGVVIATVEHALSALAGLGVTDALLEVGAEGPVAEVPILDGSADALAHALLDAGLRDLPDPLEPIAPVAPIEVREGPASIRLEPAGTPHLRYDLDYSGPGPEPIRRQAASWAGDADAYRRDIAPARTFSLAPEARALHAAGLFTHVTPRDMLVLDPATPERDATPIDNTLRFPDEPARHKLLDLIGDLALAGAPIRGRIVAHRSGHALTHAFVRALLAHRP